MSHTTTPLNAPPPAPVSPSASNRPRIAMVTGIALAVAFTVTGLTVGTILAAQPAFQPPAGCVGSDSSGPISCDAGAGFDSTRECDKAVRTTIDELRRSGATGAMTGGCGPSTGDPAAGTASAAEPRPVGPAGPTADEPGEPGHTGIQLRGHVQVRPT